MNMKRSVVYGPTLLILFLFSFTLLSGCGGEPELDKIAVSPAEKTVTIGETIEFKAEALSEENEPMPEAEINWSLDPADRGSIDSSGVFTAKKPGKVIVKAASGDVSGQAQVTIEPEEAASISLEPEKEKALPGSSISVTGNLLTADGDPAGFNTVTLSAMTDGTELSTESLEADEQGGFSFEITLTPEPGPNTVLLKSGPARKELVLEATRITKLVISPKQETFEVNEEVDFQAQGFDRYGNSRPLEVKWSLSGNKAKLMEDGRVKMLATGEAVLVADYKDLTQGRPFTIVPGELAEIKLHPEKVTLQAGQSAYMKATGRNSHGYTLPVEPSWSLSDDLGNIDQDGLFVARKAGTGTITAKANDVTASIPVEVDPGFLADIKLDLEKTKLTAGEELDLKAQGFDAFGNPVTVEPVWSLDNALGRIDKKESLLTVYQSGQGEVRAQKGNILESLQIEVSPAELHRLQILPANPSLEAGNEVKFEVKGFDRFDNPVEVDPSLKLRDKLGKLAADGTFTAKDAGNTVLTAKQGEIETSTSLAVIPGKMVEAVLEPKAPVTLKAGELEEFIVYGLDALGNTVPSRAAWTLSPSDLGTVDSQGILTAKKTGKGTISAEIIDIRTETVLRVENTVQVKPGEPVRIEIDPEKASLAAGEKRAFQATVFDKFGNEINTAVDWSLESESIGSISKNGIFKAVKSGTWQITAGVKNIRARAEVSVAPGEIAYNNVTPAALSLKAGETQKLEAVSEDRFGNVIPADVVWKVHPEDLGYVNEDNLFVAQKTGQGYLTAVANDIAQKLPLEVNKGPLSRISIITPRQNVASGTTIALQAKGTDPGKNQVEVKPSWSVRPEEAGEIDEQGNFTAKKAGTLSITAKSQGVESSVTLEVIPGQASEIKVENQKPLELTAGDSTQLELLAFDQNGNRIQDPDFSFQVEDKLGSVLADNRFKAHKSGTGNIVVSLGQARTEIPVKVETGPVQRIEVKPEQAKVDSGSKITFKAKAFDQEGNPVELDPSWTVIGGIGSVTENGEFTAHSVGQGFVSCQMSGVAGLSRVQVEPGNVARIEVNPGKMTLNAGESGQFRATAYDAQGNEVPVDVSWSLEEGQDLGSLEEDGSFKARKSGQVVVSAAFEDKRGQAEAEIVPAEMSELVLDRQSLELVSGKTAQLEATGRDSFGNKVQVEPDWSVQPESLAAIDSSGSITAKKAGSGTVTAEKDGMSASLELTVTPGQLDSIRIQPPDGPYKAGKTYDFEAAGLDAGGNKIEISPNWAVTTHIGNIDRETGKFTPRKVGKGSVEAYQEGIVASRDIEVVPGDPAQLFIDPNPVTVKSGRTQTFTVKGVDREKNEVRVPELQWSVQGNIGFFEKPAQFSATNEGSGKIIARSDGLQAESYVNVVAGEPDMDNTRVRAEQASVPANGQDSATIIVIVRDGHNNPVPDVQVKLVSSRQGDELQQPGRTDELGRTTGKVSSENKGTSIITALINQEAVRDNVRINFR
ncbi:MAG: Ig-like domain-containing protein [Desulfohalobiaceae bacterium]|nr:Ig-like domain-containing protein [Desulfohalobiaceae bacterium]